MAKRPALHPAHGEDVSDPGEEPVADPILRPPAQAWTVGDGDLTDASSLQPQQRRQEAVHALEELDAPQIVRADGSQGTSHVRDRLTRDEVAEAIGDARGDASYDPVAALLTHAADHVRIVEGGEQQGDVRGIVLQVGIEGDCDVAAHAGEARREGRRLPVMPVEGDHANAGITLRELAHPRQAAVTAAVVHEEDLDALTESAQGGVQLVVQGVEGLLLVVHRHDDGELGSIGHSGLAAEDEPAPQIAPTARGRADGDVLGDPA
jgi:hypothetical protein